MRGMYLNYTRITPEVYLGVCTKMMGFPVAQFIESPDTFNSKKAVELMAQLSAG